MQPFNYKIFKKTYYIYYKKFFEKGGHGGSGPPSYATDKKNLGQNLLKQGCPTKKSCGPPIFKVFFKIDLYMHICFLNRYLPYFL